MPKIHLANDSKQSIGGGWSFMRNFKFGLDRLDTEWELARDWRDSDVVLIPGATMVVRESVKAFKSSGKKVVLRVDNVPRNSRNRNTGTSRLRDFAQMADFIVWQSEWAWDYLGIELNPPNTPRVIIYNGVNTDVFNEDGLKYGFEGDPVYLYSRYNRDATKRWEEAWYKYQLIQRENPDAFLVIVGNFSPEQIEYNFDFFMGERYQYMGVIDNPSEMAKIYRSCDYFLATYFNDCYSNTYLEALSCGVELHEPNMSGGTPELLEVGARSVEDMVEDYLEVFDELL